MRCFSWERRAMVWASGLSAVLGGATSPAWAAGFSIHTQSASGLGTAGAADAAGTQDISAIYSNPAAIRAFAGQHFSLGLAGIEMNTKFRDGVRKIPTVGVPAANEPKTKVNDFSKSGYVPALYGTHQVTADFGLGWSVTVPLATNSHYGREWVGRYHGIDTELQVTNFDLGGAYSILSHLHVGAGLQIQEGKGKLSGASNFGALTGVAAAEGKADIIAEYEGDNVGYGFTAGVLYNVLSELDIGMSYRSRVQHETTGDITFTGETPASAAYVESQAYETEGQLKITVPDVLSLGVSFKPTQDLTLFANVTQTKWSTLENLDLKYKNKVGDQRTLAKLEWKDVLSCGLGGAYQVHPHIVVRTGIARDNSPSNDRYRSPRSPDGDRTIFALGGGYIGEGWHVDAALSHTAVKDPTLDLKESDYPEAKGRGDLTGRYKISANTLMVQYGYQL